MAYTVRQLLMFVETQYRYNHIVRHHSNHTVVAALGNYSRTSNFVATAPNINQQLEIVAAGFALAIHVTLQVMGSSIMFGCSTPW
jgi:hypothetical protein